MPMILMLLLRHAAMLIFADRHVPADDATPRNFADFRHTPHTLITLPYVSKGYAMKRFAAIRR